MTSLADRFKAMPPGALAVGRKAVAANANAFVNTDGAEADGVFLGTMAHPWANATTSGIFYFSQYALTQAVVLGIMVRRLFVAHNSH